MSDYKKPDKLKNNMGGENGKYSVAMNEVLKLLNEAPNLEGKVLDLGLGKGQIAEWMTEKGASVTSIGLEIDSYGADLDKLVKKGISIIESDVENMPFNNETYDIVIASHILEHIGNLSKSLEEIHRVLKKEGWLYVFIPPYNAGVISGHVNTGWNIGQLMYVLLLNGFNVKDGQFIKGDYSVCGYVKKSNEKLPALRYDEGDIHILNKADLWPVPVKENNGIADRFYGDILALNWKGAESIINNHTDAKMGKRAIKRIAKIIHKILGDYYFKKVSEVFFDESNSDVINPLVLK